MVPDMGRVQISLNNDEDVEMRKAIAKRPDLFNIGNDQAGKILLLERCREIVK